MLYINFSQTSHHIQTNPICKDSAEVVLEKGLDYKKYHKINTLNFETEEHFKYLEATKTADNDVIEDIKGRIH